MIVAKGSNNLESVLPGFSRAGTTTREKAKRQFDEMADVIVRIEAIEEDVAKLQQAAEEEIVARAAGDKANADELARFRADYEKREADRNAAERRKSLERAEVERRKSLEREEARRRKSLEIENRFKSIEAKQADLSKEQQKVRNSVDHLC